MCGCRQLFRNIAIMQFQRPSTSRKMWISRTLKKHSCLHMNSNARASRSIDMGAKRSKFCTLGIRTKNSCLENLNIQEGVRGRSARSDMDEPVWPHSIGTRRVNTMRERARKVMKYRQKRLGKYKANNNVYIQRHHYSYYDDEGSRIRVFEMLP